MEPTKEGILEILQKIIIPGKSENIVSLGMIREIGMEKGSLFIHVGLQGDNACLQESVRRLVESKLRSSFDLKEIRVQISTSAPKTISDFHKIRLTEVQHIILIASGKGGVGKTTVAVNLAVALKKKNQRVGLVDADIYGPNVPLMLGISSERRTHFNSNGKIVPLEAQGIKLISMGVLVPENQPMIWRGPMLHSAVTGFLQRVDWGELDFLVIDLPPGTGDIQLSLAQNFCISGAIIVTTPQEAALLSVRKSIAMFEKTEVPVWGVIENMTGDIFGYGGGRKIAEQHSIPFLSEIPLEPSVREGGDLGIPIVLSELEVAKRFFKIAEKILEQIQQFANSEERRV